MKTKLITATALALSSFSPVALSPAFAQVSTDVQAELDAYCVALVPPGDHNPNFVITAENIVEGVSSGGGETVTGFVEESEHRHGGSPNIFGLVTVETTGGFTSYDFDCQTFNPQPQSEQGAYPSGLQFPGQSTQLFNENVVESEEDAVICISPTKNPGAWRNKEYYSGTCSTAVFYSLAGIPEPIPSNSLPD